MTKHILRKEYGTFMLHPDMISDENLFERTSIYLRHFVTQTPYAVPLSWWTPSSANSASSASVGSGSGSGGGSGSGSGSGSGGGVGVGGVGVGGVDESWSSSSSSTMTTYFLLFIGCVSSLSSSSGKMKHDTFKLQMPHHQRKIHFFFLLLY